MTIADKIRGMSDEELAKWLDWNCHGCPAGKQMDYACQHFSNLNKTCDEVMLKYLQRDVKYENDFSIRSDLQELLRR